MPRRAAEIRGVQRSAKRRFCAISALLDTSMPPAGEDLNPASQPDDSAEQEAAANRSASVQTRCGERRLPSTALSTVFRSRGAVANELLALTAAAGAAENAQLSCA